MTSLDEGQRIKLPGEDRYVVVESAVTVSDGTLKLIVDDRGDLRKAALSADEAAGLEALTEDGGAEQSAVLAGLWVEWMRRASQQASATALATNPLRPYPHQNRAVYGATALPCRPLWNPLRAWLNAESLQLEANPLSRRR